ncbi:transporter substrate-binding domain-containing protein [Vreelandella sulfidaeris]|uniref:transporter substrate-binding domain-containing protein n=1 Tax=Vreelandella sulfidaeris TaxID=115553 RepID=UPI0019D4399D|nr:transporter substrate-binding domain-containing protein [Halomonas sulfidaeris]
MLMPLTMFSGCDASEPTITQADPPEPGGTLQVATRNSATTYYLDRDGTPAGPEHDLVESFAEAHDWQVEWTLFESTSEVLQALKEGNIQLAAAGLTHLPSRDEYFQQGPTHTDIVEQLVCHRDMRPLPRQVEDMVGVDIRVTADSSYAEKLQSLVNQYTGFTFEEDPRTTEMLLTEVAEKRIDCTLADSNIVRVVRRHFPHLEIAMNLTSGDRLGWYLPPGTKRSPPRQISGWRAPRGKKTSQGSCNTTMPTSASLTLSTCARSTGASTSAYLTSSIFSWRLRKKPACPPTCLPPWPIRSRTGIPRPFHQRAYAAS